MIRITVEMLPGGSETRKKTLVVGKITNTLDSPLRPRLGNYDVTLRNKNGRRYRGGRIVGWPRTRRHIWALVHTAIGAALDEKESK